MDAERIEALVQKGLAAEAAEKAAEKAEVDEELQSLWYDIKDLTNRVDSLVGKYYDTTFAIKAKPSASCHPSLTSLPELQIHMQRAFDTISTMSQ